MERIEFYKSQIEQYKSQVKALKSKILRLSLIRLGVFLLQQLEYISYGQPPFGL